MGSYVLHLMLGDFGIPSKLFEIRDKRIRFGCVLYGYVLTNILPSPGWGMHVHAFSLATNPIVS